MIVINATMEVIAEVVQVSSDSWDMMFMIIFEVWAIDTMKKGIEEPMRQRIVGILGESSIGANTMRWISRGGDEVLVINIERQRISCRSRGIENGSIRYECIMTSTM